MAEVWVPGLQGATRAVMLRLLPSCAAALGLLMLFHEMFASGLALYPSDPADPRYIQFVLEHSWRWLRGAMRLCLDARRFRCWSRHRIHRCPCWTLLASWPGPRFVNR